MEISTEILHTAEYVVKHLLQQDDVEIAVGRGTCLATSGKHIQELIETVKTVALQRGMTVLINAKPPTDDLACNLVVRRVNGEEQESPR